MQCMHVDAVDKQEATGEMQQTTPEGMHKFAHMHTRVKGQIAVKMSTAFIKTSVSHTSCISQRLVRAVRSVSGQVKLRSSVRGVHLVSVSSIVQSIVHIRQVIGTKGQQVLRHCGGGAAQHIRYAAHVKGTMHAKPRLSIPSAKTLLLTNAPLILLCTPCCALQLEKGARYAVPRDAQVLVPGSFAERTRAMHATCVVTGGRTHTFRHKRGCHGKDMLQNSLCGHQLWQPPHA